LGISPPAREPRPAAAATIANSEAIAINLICLPAAESNYPSFRQLRQHFDAKISNFSYCRAAQNVYNLSMVEGANNLGKAGADLRGLAAFVSMAARFLRPCRGSPTSACGEWPAGSVRL
jgi:hypothetical protein